MALGEAGFDPPLDGADDSDEFDLQRLKELTGFLVRAPRRHPRTAVVSLCLTLTLGLVVAALWPRSYRCDVRIAVQNNLVLPALGNPNRAVPRDADMPTTKNAADAIHRRDNIVAMIHELDLVNRWRATRQPIQRLKDKVMGASKDDDERLRDMIAVVGNRLAVYSDDASITLSIEWPDRETAFEILSFVQKNFLEARYHNNVNVIVEALRILEERREPQAANVDAALAELLKCEAERNAALHPGAGNAKALPGPETRSPPGKRGKAAAPVSVAASAPREGDLETDGTVAQVLKSVRRRSQLMTEERDRQRSEAHRQLLDARSTLGPLHPTVIALKQKIDQLSEPESESKVLDERERRLIAELAGSAAHSPAPAPDDSRSAVASNPVVTPPASVDVRDDSRTALARAKLQTASTKYGELLSRIEAAKIELDVTQAAFKFQYAIVRPPELPRNPSKPNVALLVVGSALLSIIMTLLVPAGLDLCRGRFVEARQVERKLRLPILGRLSPPSRP